MIDLSLLFLLHFFVLVVPAAPVVVPAAPVVVVVPFALAVSVLEDGKGEEGKLEEDQC